MVSDSEIADRLRELLSTSDLTTTTTAIVRGKLEEDFGIDLRDKKAFIREQVDIYLESQQQNEEEAKNSSKRGSKKQNKEVKKRGGGFTKLCSLSPQLQKFIGVPELSRTEVVKQLWGYIREHDMQDPSNRRNIRCDEPFRELFEVDSIDMFQMNKALAKHIWPLGSDGASVSSAPKEKQRKDREEDPDDEPKRKEKRQKGAGGSGGGSGILAPIPLSDALVRFLGTGENALTRSNVVKRIWDYIKQNNLQDPSDKRRILCDDKLKELFDVDTFTGFTVLRLLAPHFIKPESISEAIDRADGEDDVMGDSSEVRDRWSMKANDCVRLLTRLKKRMGLLKERDAKIEQLQSELEVERSKKVRNLRKYKSGLHNITSLNQQVEELKKQNAELLAQNQVLEKKVSHPNLPPGTVPNLQAELDRLKESLAQVERNARLSQGILASKEKSWVAERAKSEAAIFSLNDTNRSLVEQKVKLVEDRNWLIREGLQEFVGKLLESREFLGPHEEVCRTALIAGFVDGVQAGYRGARLKTPMNLVPQFDIMAGQKHDEALVSFSQVRFSYLDALAAASELPLEEIRKITPAAPFKENLF